MTPHNPLECAVAHPERFGVMGLLDVCKPDAAGLVAEWRRQSGMLGLRVIVTQRGRAQWSADDAVESFWRACVQHRLPVTVMAPGALDYVAELAEWHPDLELCVDHLGLPFDEAMLEQWYGEVAALARHRLLHLKLSTLPLRSAEPYPFADTHRLAAHVYQLFGAQRLLWGTDHTQALGQGRVSYGEELRFAREQLDFLSDEERRAVLGGNAERFLRWPAGTPSTEVEA